MLNEELFDFDDKDRKICYLQSLIDKYKAYDRERKHYIHSLLDYISELEETSRLPAILQKMENLRQEVKHKEELVKSYKSQVMELKKVLHLEQEGLPVHPDSVLLADMDRRLKKQQKKLEKQNNKLARLRETIAKLIVRLNENRLVEEDLLLRAMAQSQAKDSEETEAEENT